MVQLLKFITNKKVVMVSYDYVKKTLVPAGPGLKVFDGIENLEFGRGMRFTCLGGGFRRKNNFR